MSNIDESLASLMGVSGAIVASIVDSNSGMMLGQDGAGIDLELASAGNTEVVRAKLRTMETLKLNDKIEDMLITLGKQYHIICPIDKNPGLFIYFVLDKAKANLALARHHVKEVEHQLVV
ncbi:hypothetical protein HV213_09090 [Klebsiella sp. RHBSTW-00484]|uniref:hypothetical protein n=1 Tax=unclassified Klebsiella TaxID=2608929 RepID=UPI0015E56F9D|nr:MULTISPECIES: hypothetical protein [unclassified Klebsiella]MBA7848236.1 hypothetical protein [Klebsiella sp. RHBSTW-00465]QLO35968.1 hypothetical protein HV213_09090 [Klebsiella sp. RHBSTW-00484]QLT75484.1 hypothetical protein HV204_09090 [Klebsiella sp. RHBSTW-00464]